MSFGSLRPEPDWDQLFQSRILPALGVAGGGVAKPRWTFVCGQSGAGKSRVVGDLCQTLGPELTQSISGDALIAELAGIFADQSDPATRDLLKRFKSSILPIYCQALAERAASLRAHVIWERARPLDTLVLAPLARALGYRVDCVILAVPLLESWLATLRRDAGRSEVSGGVSWARQVERYHRWPAFLARAEKEHAFDTLRVVGRDGAVFHENRLAGGEDPTRWTEPPFAVESLIVERLRPRSADEVERLVTDWQALRADPDIAFRNRDAWPWSSIAGLGAQILALRDDPSAGFDLAAPGEAEAGRGWVARLRADLDAALASPEAKGLASLAPRAERLLALVGSVLDQAPTGR